MIISSDWCGPIVPRSRVRERYIFLNKSRRERCSAAFCQKLHITPIIFIVVLFVLVVSNEGVFFLWYMDSL